MMESGACGGHKSRRYGRLENWRMLLGRSIFQILNKWILGKRTRLEYSLNLDDDECALDSNYNRIMKNPRRHNIKTSIPNLGVGRGTAVELGVIAEEVDATKN